MTFKVHFQSVLLQIKFLWRKIYGKLGIPLSSKYLPVQSQQHKHLKKVWNMCKFNSDNTRTISVTLFWCVYYWLWAYFTPFYWCLYCWLWTNKCLFGDNLFVIDWNSSLTLNNTRTISVTLFWCVYYWLWAYFTPFYWCLYCWLWTNKCLFGDNLFVIDWNSSLTRGRYHIETICRANQWTGFYMITVSVIKELNGE